MAKITMKDIEGTYSVSVKQEQLSSMTLGDVIDTMIKPLLLAAGYSPDVLAKYIPGE